MNQLRTNDLGYVLARTPRNVIELLKNNDGIYLAGGYIRAILSGEKISDIDLFLSAEKDVDAIVKDFTKNTRARTHKTDNAVSVFFPGKLPIQFIFRWRYDNPIDLINSFDFTVCQVAIHWKKKTSDTGAHWISVCSESFYPDLATKHIVYTVPIRVEEAGGSLLRVIKMVKKGYSIRHQELAKVVSRMVSAVNVDIMAKDEKGHMLESSLSIILTGLLREVDPLTFFDGMAIEENEKEKADINRV